MRFDNSGHAVPATQSLPAGTKDRPVGTDLATVPPQRYRVINTDDQLIELA
ncbi:hypothetical protein J6590_046606 [Homalodisca vitripennis]|nr:hypothetical protein J6590_046606 [Homalodisca vitripennis]